MSQSLGRFPVFFLIIFSLLLLASCGPAQSAAPIATLTVPPIELFTTAIPSSSQSTLAINTPENAEPEPTPTPLSYTIVAGDTLLGIAERHGISLDQLLVANPGLDARFLSINDQILIPQGEGGLAVAPQEDSLVDLNLGEALCFGTSAGELWCLLSVTNNTSSAVENAVATLTLISSAGDIVAKREAFGLIQKLDSGQSMPLLAYWPSAPQNWAAISSQLISAFRLDDPAARYVETELDIFKAIISADGLSAQVSAELSAAEFAQVQNLRILAIAYDKEGQPIGLRRIELEQGENEFDFEVFSLGPQIDSVEVLVEARR